MADYGEGTLLAPPTDTVGGSCDAADHITGAVPKYNQEKAHKKLRFEAVNKRTAPVPFSVFEGDALEAYDFWAAPACIIADGPYGLGKFPGEPVSPDGLAEWYAPHAVAWARHALPFTTLWFWNSEIGWAKAHPALEAHGWQYEETVIWNKGIAHVAGNCNSKTIRGVPLVTELAVRYTRKVTLETVGGRSLPIKEWLRAEWLRSGRPMYESNMACGVVNAATRKYLTQCHMWYFPPPATRSSEWQNGARSMEPIPIVRIFLSTEKMNRRPKFGIACARNRRTRTG